ncbi:hypothetical protein ABT214_32585, partial [Micromonospora purpureochromogenes]
MGRRVLGGLTLAAVAGGVALRALVVPRRGRWPRAAGADPRPGRWQVVTVDRPPPAVLPGGGWP